ncbi:MAG: VCBS repeat-containing protein [Verrucomicrobiota bacterium]
MRDIVSGGYMGVPFFVRATANGWEKPVILRDREGGHLEAGRFWNPDTRKHVDGKVPKWGSPDRAYSALALDWDGDGDQDLLRGTSKGSFLIRINEGSPGKHAFATQAVALETAIPGQYAMPVAQDWDGDGLWDLISGSQTGEVYWFRNTGSPKEPDFSTKPTQLVEGAEAEGRGRGSHAQVEVCDWDGDGDLDLLVGDCHLHYDREKQEWDNHGYIWLYRREAQSR